MTDRDEYREHMVEAFESVDDLLLCVDQHERPA